MRLLLRGVGLVAVISLCGVPALAQQQPEPALAVGTWKLNPARSTGSSSQLKAKSRIHGIEHRGGGVVVYRIEQVEADGSTQVTYFTGMADGTPYPMITVRADGTANVSTMTETRIDSHTIRFVITNPKGQANGGRRVVAKDGKSYSLVGDNGGTLVYELQ